jgi:hypothetical protein
MVQSHSLIEHEAFTLPAAFPFGHLFQVVEDATP